MDRLIISRVGIKGFILALERNTSNLLINNITSLLKSVMLRYSFVSLARQIHKQNMNRLPFTKTYLHRLISLKNIRVKILSFN